VRSKRIASQGQGRESLVVVFDKGDQAVAGLTDLARRERLGAGQLTAIGGFSRAVLGYFDRDRQRYRKIPVDEQVEVLSLLGDLVLHDGEPKVHAHVVLGRPDGTTVGGHLMEGEVWPTLEVVLTEAPGALRKRIDPETGLALIDLEAS
jgi:predicted DNA-binding protein with PD1-like motif